MVALITYMPQFDPSTKLLLTTPLVSLYLTHSLHHYSSCFTKAEIYLVNLAMSLVTVYMLGDWRHPDVVVHLSYTLLGLIVVVMVMAIEQEVTIKLIVFCWNLMLLAKCVILVLDNWSDFEQVFWAGGAIELYVFWLGVLILGVVVAVVLRLAGSPSLIVRKVFHFQAFILFVRGVHSPVLLVFAFSLALFGFVLIEALRLYLSWIPLVSTFNTFLQSFTDRRDSGPLILTHTYLLFGCAYPYLIWYPSREEIRSDVWYSVCLSGILMLCIGDSIASIVGSTLGRVKWPGSSKTLEGTLAGFISVIVVWNMVIQNTITPTLLWPIGFVTPFAIGMVYEAFTKQIDNLVLPVLTSTLVIFFTVN